MRRAEVCGAVTGALMVLGLRYGPRDAADTSRDIVYSKVSEFLSRFEEGCGSIICRDLLGCDLSTPEGMKQAVKNDLFKTVCPKMIEVAADLVEEL